MPLVRQAVTENGGLENYSVMKVLHWLEPRWPHAAFELTYSKLNPKLHSLREKLKKRQAAEVANAGAGTSAAAAAAPAPLVGDPATLSEGDAEMTHAGAVPTSAHAGAGTSAAAAAAAAPLAGDPAMPSEGDGEMTHAGGVPTSAHAGAGTSAAGDVDPDDAGGVTTHALAVTAVGRDVEECASTLAALEVTHARSLEAQTAKLKDELAELKAQNGELNQTITRLEGRLNEVAELKAQNAELNQTITRLEGRLNEVAELKAQNAELNETITRLEGRFTLSNQAHQSEIAKNARVEKRFAVLKRKWEDFRALALQ